MQSELDALYRQQAGALVRWATLMVRDRDVAEDIVHDAFIKADTYWSATEGHPSADSWMRTIVKNLCKDWLKNVRRQDESYDQDEAYSPWPSPEQSLLREELGQMLLKAMRKLSPSMLHVFLRYHVDGEAMETVAAELDLGVGAAKMRALRARALLRRSLSHYMDAA